MMSALFLSATIASVMPAWMATGAVAIAPPASASIFNRPVAVR